ncbi:phage portal protein family protein [Aeromonas rivuli]|uniref:phage portal protein family protein n=1 Tax=Aeromonas rivuli TaxID=648794 RepID=UPI000A0291D5|nr:DUF935 family protein [Aeromonas rivuli]
MPSNAVISSSLVTRLPAAGNRFTDYYPTPLGLGMHEASAFDPYWGAIEAMLFDEEVSADVELRHAASLTLPWYLEGAPDDIAFAERVLAGLPVEKLLEDALSAAEWGFSPLEVDWDNSTGPLCPVHIERRKSRLFRLDDKGQVYYATQGAMGFTPVPTGKIIPVRRQATRETPYGASILESVWPIWQVKWTHVAQLERLGQKYSVPSVAALAEASAGNELDVISATLAGLESGEGVALSGVKELIQLTANGKAPELLQVIQHYDSKICKRITGQTLTSSTQQYGSRSLGEVHERAALRISIGDLEMAFANLNTTLLRWIFTFNQQPGRVTLVFDKKAFEATLKATQTNAPSGVTLSNDGGGLLCL